MSNVSSAPPDFDFWEFVNCARCQLPFVSQAGATIPFWLTECGHIICNNHLNADQSCSVCASTGIQLVPLQQEMDPPMSDWFRSVPFALDSVAYAAKFQQESMAAQIRFFRTRHQQQRGFIDKLKQEINDLRRRLQYATQEVNYQPQQQTMDEGMDHRQMEMQEPSNMINRNGKRPMMDQQRPMTASSAHSDPTPVIGRNRLTLPPGQQPQLLASNRADEPTHHDQHLQQRARQPPPRPGSRSFQQQYAYAPPSTPRMPPPQVAHAQNRNHIQRTNHIPPPPPSAVAMPPPPPPGAGGSKFKPAQSQNRRQEPSRSLRPPATPVMGQQAQVQRQVANTGSLSHQQVNNIASSTSNRFLPPSERFAPPTHIKAGGGTKRFMPPTPAQGGFSRSASMMPAAGNSGSGNRQPLARAGTAISNNSGGGQRIPFVPGPSFA